MGECKVVISVAWCIRVGERALVLFPEEICRVGEFEAASFFVGEIKRLGGRTFVLFPSGELRVGERVSVVFFAGELSRVGVCAGLFVDVLVVGDWGILEFLSAPGAEARVIVVVVVVVVLGVGGGFFASVERIAREFVVEEGLFATRVSCGVIFEEPARRFFLLDFQCAVEIPARAQLQ